VIALHPVRPMGYSDDSSGYCPPFAWWRMEDRRHIWFVQSYQLQFGLTGYAVMDDFGTLRKI
jgi:hypothetical protein